MKKMLTLFFAFFLIAGIMTSSQISAQAATKQQTKPAISASLKPCIAQYKAGNYVGAIQDITTLLEKEPDNMYAKYYLALSYTQLGDKEKAQTLYKEVADSQQGSALSYYSQKAFDCLANPNGEACNPNVSAQASSSNPSDPKAAEELDDITKFIRSGKQIHPAAMDQITKERMERKLQQEEYQRKIHEQNAQNQNMQNYQSSAMPTNEEIAAALNTLSKLGMNPYAQTYPLTQAMQYNPYMTNPMANNMFLGNGSKSDFAKMFLYSQMAQNQNTLLNLGM